MAPGTLRVAGIPHDRSWGSKQSNILLINLHLWLMVRLRDLPRQNENRNRHYWNPKYSLHDMRGCGQEQIGQLVQKTIDKLLDRAGQRTTQNAHRCDVMWGWSEWLSPGWTEHSSDRSHIKSKLKRVVQFDLRETCNRTSRGAAVIGDLGVGSEG